MTKKIGLALSGGGARGFAHIGVLQVLVENEIPIDLVTGTSAGSIVGAAYAAGLTPDEIASMATRATWLNLTRPSLSPLGLLSNEPMGAFLNRELPVNRFEDLRMPYGAVVYDLEASSEVVFKTSGDLITAIRASCAVPGIFVPVRDPLGRFLVDGGAVCPTPTEPARNLGADLVIAVDLIACGSSFRNRPRTAAGIMFQSALAMLRTASAAQGATADILIVPQIAHLRPDEIGKRDEFIRLGREAAELAVGEIKQAIGNG